jgi:hypothetical protein
MHKFTRLNPRLQSIQLETSAWVNKGFGGFVKTSLDSTRRALSRRGNACKNKKKQKNRQKQASPKQAKKLLFQPRAGMPHEWHMTRQRIRTSSPNQQNGNSPPTRL